MISPHRPGVSTKTLFALMTIAVTFAAAAAEPNESARVETALLAKAANNESITQADDPALAKLGEAMVRFLRERDVKVYEAAAMMTVDAMWADAIQLPEDKRPPRAELEKAWPDLQGRIRNSARQLADLMTIAGIDLKSAEIVLKEVSARELTGRAGIQSVDGLTAGPVTFTFAVKSDAKSSTGKTLSGEYILSASRAMRVRGRWFIDRWLHWKQIPEGILDDKTLAAIELEKYVAANRALPQGTAAPDVEVVRIGSQQKMKLSELRGKVVVLDFWASWCVPCHEPMSKMQEYLREHPAWKGRVELVSLSIDETLTAAATHLQRRGWNNTLNLWAGPGAWSAAATKAYRVTSVPTSYIIDAQGKIAASGSPAGMDIAKEVDQLLKTAGPTLKP